MGLGPRPCPYCRVCSVHYLHLHCTTTLDINCLLGLVGACTDRRHSGIKRPSIFPLCVACTDTSMLPWDYEVGYSTCALQYGDFTMRERERYEKEGKRDERGNK